MTVLDIASLLQFGDSMLPTGAFSFSNALESAVQTGLVRNAADLQLFVLSAVEQAAHGDGVGVVWAVRESQQALFSASASQANVRSEVKPDISRVRRIDQALFARKISEEARNMTVRTGRKLAELGLAVTGLPLIAQWLEAIRLVPIEGASHSASENKVVTYQDIGGTPGTQPVTLAVLMTAVFCANHAYIPNEDSDELPRLVLSMYLYSVAAGMVNAALRLMRVTHTETQFILRYLSPHLSPFVDVALATPLHSMHGATPMTDILSSVHARAHVRLFMS